MLGNRSHLSFSGGPHECPGQEIGRAITDTGIDTLLMRLTDLHLAVDDKRLTWLASWVSRHLVELPVAFELRRPQTADDPGLPVGRLPQPPGARRRVCRLDGHRGRVRRRGRGAAVVEAASAVSAEGALGLGARPLTGSAAVRAPARRPPSPAPVVRDAPPRRARQAPRRRESGRRGKSGDRRPGVPGGARHVSRVWRAAPYSRGP